MDRVLLVLLVKVRVTETPLLKLRVCCSSQAGVAGGLESRVHSLSQIIHFVFLPSSKLGPDCEEDRKDLLTSGGDRKFPITSDKYDKDKHSAEPEGSLEEVTSE